MKRIDVLSDTHGRLSDAVFEQLEGCDLIIHAGDITSESDYFALCALAPVRACLGNNDWPGEYGQDVTKFARFEYEGLHFSVNHYRERVEPDSFDVGIGGHTHVPFIRRLTKSRLLMNSGSPTFPLSSEGPTMGRIWVEDGNVRDARIVRLADGGASPSRVFGR